MWMHVRRSYQLKALKARFEIPGYMKNTKTNMLARQRWAATLRSTDRSSRRYHRNIKNASPRGVASVLIIQTCDSFVSERKIDKTSNQHMETHRQADEEELS